MKRALIISLLVLPLVCAAPVLGLALLTSGRQAVRVITIPTFGGRGLLLITTPCAANKSGSLGLWTARSSITSVRIVALYTWPEQREFLGNGIVNRLLLRVATFRRC